MTLALPLFVYPFKTPSSGWLLLLMLHGVLVALAAPLSSIMFYAHNMLTTRPSMLIAESLRACA